MPTFYVFKASTGTARTVTDDRTGAKLPKRRIGSWVYEKDFDLNPGDKETAGVSSDEIIQATKRNGYFLWPLSSAVDDERKTVEAQSTTSTPSEGKQT
jgi:hypothetical protein